MAALLYETFPQVSESRLTSVWHSLRQQRDRGGQMGCAHFIELPGDQHVDLEADWLSSHLPCSLGGLGGVFPDGRPWLITLQHSAPGGTGAGDPGDLAWMDLSVARALRFNPGARVSLGRPLHRVELERAYQAAGVPAGGVTDWDTAELLVGLLANCCGVALADLVQGIAGGCSLPGVSHTCQQDVFEDAFANWQARRVAPGDDSRR